MFKGLFDFKILPVAFIFVRFNVWDLCVPQPFKHMLQSYATFNYSDLSLPPQFKDMMQI